MDKTLLLSGPSPTAGVSAPCPKSLNLGIMKDLHKQSQSVFPMFFEGVGLLVHKGLSNHLQVGRSENDGLHGCPPFSPGSFSVTDPAVL